MRRIKISKSSLEKNVNSKEHYLGQYAVCIFTILVRAYVASLLKLCPERMNAARTMLLLRKSCNSEACNQLSFNEWGNIHDEEESNLLSFSLLQDVYLLNGGLDFTSSWPQKDLICVCIVCEVVL